MWLFLFILFKRTSYFDLLEVFDVHDTKKNEDNPSNMYLRRHIVRNKRNRMSVLNHQDIKKPRMED